MLGEVSVVWLLGPRVEVEGRTAAAGVDGEERGQREGEGQWRTANTGRDRAGEGKSGGVPRGRALDGCVDSVM